MSVTRRFEQKDLSSLGDAFGVLASLGGDPPELPPRITGLSHDPETGILIAQSLADASVLNPRQRLVRVSQVPHFIARTSEGIVLPEKTSGNIRLGAKIGEVALGELANREVRFAVSSLAGIQHAARAIADKAAVGLISSDLPRKDAADALWKIATLVNPNSRVIQTSLRRRLEAEPEDGPESL